VVFAVVLKADIRSHLGLCRTQEKGHAEPKPAASQRGCHQWLHFGVSSHSTPFREAGGDHNRAMPWPEELGCQAHYPARGARRVGRAGKMLPVPHRARHCSPCEGQAPL